MTERTPVPNGLFDERPWRDVPCYTTMNQEPALWGLQWYDIGDVLDAPRAGAGDTESIATTRPECVHRTEDQLPPHEHRYLADGSVNPNRIIYDLEATTVYKMFAGGGSFGTLLFGADPLRLIPGSRARLYFPVRVHAHGNGDTGAAYWRIMTSDAMSEWFTFKRDFADRTYFVGTVDVIVPSHGEIDYILQSESHTVGGIDFFVSGVRWEYVDMPEPTECAGLPREDYARVVNVIPERPGATSASGTAAGRSPVSCVAAEDAWASEAGRARLSAKTRQIRAWRIVVFLFICGPPLSSDLRLSS